MIGGVYGLWERENVGEAWFIMSSIAYDKAFAAAKYSSILLDHVQGRCKVATHTGKCAY